MLLLFNNMAVLAAQTAGPNWVKMIIIAVVIGLVVGLIYALSLKGSMTSVHKKNVAADYVRPGSFELQRQQDNFMYSNTDKKEKPKKT